MRANENESRNRETPILLALYDQHIASIEAKTDALPPGQLADRYHQSLKHTLQNMSTERAAMQALFGEALADDAAFDLMRGQTAERLSRAYHRLVLESEDALREPKALELGIALYTFHMLVVIFWLYDRSPDQASTKRLVNLVHELFKLLRPLFLLPMIPQGIARLSEIVMPELRRDSEGAAAQDDPRDGQHQDFDIHRD